ncbi:hypothetical protein [Testudinibacter aquarius]|uniref:Uncharacterized protein n=1 Tax=Testudinibacter aquarius TaxID=1524974 RepID=A0A4R3Y454_9PAST|nr:hypothetical protein [Testudinibacter aquarius]TCV86520.1 hypothetical protein EDC16_10676 [Testudinibacter aquarius]
MKKSVEFSAKEVYERTGKAMELLINAAPKMLDDNRFLFKGQEAHGRKKIHKNKNAA